ncbi:MAG TPA: transcription antitermination factor NusB, partial [Chroococcidiopsis sp.]
MSHKPRSGKAQSGKAQPSLDPSPASTHNPRQLAFLALRAIARGAFADVALDRVLGSATGGSRDRGEGALENRRLVTELVYGSMRRQRTLDALIDQLATKPAAQQPPELRLILHLGFYQLRYLSQVPPSAAVNTTVDLAKHNGLGGLAGFVNGLLRQYIRLAELGDPLQLPAATGDRLALQHS